MAFTTVNKQTSYFNTKLYTGNGGTNAVTGVGFQPDLIWIKERSSTSSHNLVDAVRGVTKRISSDNTGVEETLSGIVSSFDSDGFTNGADNGVNENSQTYVAWNWKANGQGSSNTDGSINTTYTSVSTVSGCSISKYTGTGSNATVGHGLGVAPKMIIFKRLDSADDWTVYHHIFGATKKIDLNNTGAVSTVSSVFNDTEPTSTVMSVGTNGRTNASGGTYIVYAFAEKTGFSKFGQYTGNGNADGAFIYTGFRPEFVMVRRYDNTEEWQMTDAARDKAVSPNFARLKADNTTAESTNTTWAKIEKFSNGFKLGGTDSVSNGSGNSYIYMAFGQSLVGSNNIPNNAR